MHPASRPTGADGRQTHSYDAGLTRFVVDGKVMQTWKIGVPGRPVYLYTNHWLPAWLDGERPLVDPYLYDDRTRDSGQEPRWAGPP